MTHTELIAALSTLPIQAFGVSQDYSAVSILMRDGIFYSVRFNGPITMEEIIQGAKDTVAEHERTKHFMPPPLQPAWAEHLRRHDMIGYENEPEPDHRLPRGGYF